MDEPHLRRGWRATPHPDRFGPDDPGYEAAMVAHHTATVGGEGGYLDPRTGLFVMTAASLAARPCCEQDCRHCPWVADTDS